MCKRDTESVKVAPESVLSNRGESRRYALDQVFAGKGYLLWGEGGYLHISIHRLTVVMHCLCIRRMVRCGSLSVASSLLWLAIATSAV